MRKGRKSKARIIILYFLLMVGLVTVFLWSNQRDGPWDKSELISSASDLETLKNHQEKSILLSSKTLPLIKVPKHPDTESIKELKERIDGILEHDHLQGAIAGVSVRNSDNEIIYESGGDLRLIPASNMKILTTIAALDVLGPNYQYETEIKIDGDIKRGTLHGDLYLVGKGDPTLQDKDFKLLAESVKEHGIKKIKGSIYADDSWYDDVRYSQDLSWRHEDNYVGNAISALTVAANDDYLLGSVIIDVLPAKKVGQKPEVILRPKTDYIKIVNQGNTVAAGSALTLSDQRKHGTNIFYIQGDIPQNSDHYQRWRAVWEPTEYALRLFTEGLKKADVSFSEDRVKVKVAPREAETIVRKHSPSLARILLPFMKQSNNGLGEMLVKEMGRVELEDGSWESGLKVLQRTLISLGLNPGDISLRDGSGMSERNLMSANFLTELLELVRRESWFSVFEDSLPIGGEGDPALGGTLSYRLTDDATKGKVRAKTGSLNKVSSLAGYVETADQENLSFSILFNNYIREPVTQIQDEIVTVLAQSKLKK